MFRSPPAAPARPHVVAPGRPFGAAGSPSGRARVGFVTDRLRFDLITTIGSPRTRTPVHPAPHRASGRSG
ncbi:hypothetical protein TOK_0859 [Pseudonocardia sp. N23]|nr:hypothetical protein TOK_0859 [Pseudonocardia sp. N23]